MATLAEPIVHGKPVESELKTNTLTLFDTTVIATSSVAPAYTLAATAAFLIVAVGLASPSAILVGFLPVLCIAIAYYYLNRQDPNCGASYSWVSRTLNPVCRVGVRVDPARRERPLLRGRPAHRRRLHAAALQQLRLDQLATRRTTTAWSPSSACSGCCS